jgi:hypothetical protein
MVGFSGKKVLEIGGSLPRELVLDTLWERLGSRDWILISCPKFLEEFTNNIAQKRL